MRVLRLFTGAMLALCLVTGVYFASTFSTINAKQLHIIEAKQEKETSFEFVELAGIPVRVSRAEVKTENDEKQLTYSLLSTNGEKLTKAIVNVYYIDDKGDIRAGEGWRHQADIDSSETRTTRVLEIQKQDFKRAIIVVSSATGAFEKFTAPSDYAIPTVKLFAKGVVGLKPVKFIKSSKVLDENFCAGAQSAASGACSCGLASFSCNASQQSYSFTCVPYSRDNPACPQGPGES